MEVAEAVSLISRAIDTGHAAHGYLIVGDIKGNCSELAGQILKKLFPEEVAQIESGSHPDVITLTPEGKSRIITVDSMRDGLLEPMSVTSFSGGWKVGIIQGADRMRTESANAFLKALEEPTPKTMYLLLTDQPDSILPTIISRTQRVDLKMPIGVLEGDDYEVVANLFAARDAVGLAEKLKELKDGAEDEDVAIVRKTFYKTLMSFARALMVKEQSEIASYQRFRNVDAVEEAYRRSERSMNDEAVLSYMLDRMVF